MKCPKCNGLGFIHIAATTNHKRYDLICPTCDGLETLPNPAEFPNNCLACGEPIEAGKRFCKLHKEAEKFYDKH